MTGDVGPRLTGDPDMGDEIHPLFHGAPRSTGFRKLRKRLVRQAREAIDTYGMVRPGAPS